MGAAVQRVAWLAAAFALLAACSVKPVDLTGKACPCAPGWLCNANNLCVKSLDGESGTGGMDGGDGPGGDGGRGGTGGTGGSGRDSGAGGTGGRRDGAMEFDAAGLPDAGKGFDAAITFDAGSACPPPPAPTEPCPAQCDRCEGSTCIFDCNYPYACGLLLPPCPAGWGCTALCTGPGACAAPFGLQCADGPCLLQCGVSTCLGGRMICGTGPCETRCQGGSAPPGVECGSACSCTEC